MYVNGLLANSICGLKFSIDGKLLTLLTSLLNLLRNDGFLICFFVYQVLSSVLSIKFLFDILPRVSSF
jgi:uncharacterized membrane protein SpoIIM required for sporulation